MTKRRRALEIEWLDAHGSGTSWVAPNDIDHESAQVRSVGMEISNNTDGITLALSYAKDAEVVDAYIFIPWSGIVKVTELRAK